MSENIFSNEGDDFPTSFFQNDIDIADLLSSTSTELPAVAETEEGVSSTALEDAGKVVSSFGDQTSRIFTDQIYNTTVYQRAFASLAGGAEQNCSRERAYLSIVITVLPLWAILTSLIVFILLTFHKNLKATKVYDNCTKETAQFIYYIELRTGDISSTYNRRRTTLTIDMFDDNQNTLARVAIPGHVIFGKKDTPVNMIDDDKFLELRVTRFWLYRVNRLRGVSTIRITHNCLEHEAKIMVYGVEIKSSEKDKPKLFFPVMSYISFYGSANKPNACFDLEPLGSISVMGGSQADSSPINSHLDWIDYLILLYVASALVFCLDSMDVLKDSFTRAAPAMEKGAIGGAASYAIILQVAIIIRYLIKSGFSRNIGQGVWTYLYYGLCVLLTVGATLVWVYTTVMAYMKMCSEYHGLWLLALAISFLEIIALLVLQSFVFYLFQLFNPKVTEQYVVPEDYAPPQENQSKRSASNTAPVYRNQYPSAGGHMKQSMMPQTLHSPHHGWHHQMGPVPMQVGYHGMPSAAPMYSPQLMMTPLPGGYKTVGPTYNGAGYDVQPVMNQQQHPFQTYQHASGASPQPAASNNQVNLQGIKPGPKKVGSSESTGSTYYQQLMKNKGGVKSISQYGELLRHKKASKHAAK